MSFHDSWETRYRDGHAQRYPWDKVVSFVFRQAPRDRPRGEVKVLELGCGTASNLWFCAREGFSVAGVEGSASAVDYARQRFQEDGLEGEFHVADFTDALPFAPNTFDLVIDRGSIVCVGATPAKRAIANVARVMRPASALLFNPYSQAHSSYSGHLADEDGLIQDIETGSLIGAGPLCFYTEAMVRAALDPVLTIESLTHTEGRTTAPEASPLGPAADIHAEWIAIARKATAGPGATA